MQRSNNAENETSLHCRALPFNEDAERPISAPQPEAPQRPRLGETPSLCRRKCSRPEETPWTGFVSLPFAVHSNTSQTGLFSLQRKAHPSATTSNLWSRIRSVPCHFQSTRRRNHHRSHSSRAHTSAATSHRAQAELIASNIQTLVRLLLSCTCCLKAGQSQKCCGWIKLCSSKFLRKTPWKKRYPRSSEDAED